MKNKFYKNLSVLVTGGAGFIGSHITERLVKLGARVTVLDNFSTGSRKNLDHIKNDISVIEGDISNIETCNQAAQNQQVIFHLAALVSVPESVENPEKCYAINIEGTKNLLLAAAKNNVPRFVFTSSSAVYGSQSGICSENMHCKPESPYGFSKLMGEFWCQEYTRSFEIQTSCLRYFNVYGPRQSDTGGYAAVVAKFKSMMSQNKPITIFGDGLQTRDFIPVEKVAEANISAAMLPKEKMDGSPFNIATGKSINLFELIDMLKIEYPKYDQEVEFKPVRAGDIKHSSSNVSRYKNMIE